MCQMQRSLSSKVHTFNKDISPVLLDLKISLMNSSEYFTDSIITYCSNHKATPSEDIGTHLNQEQNTLEPGHTGRIYDWGWHPSPMWSRIPVSIIGLCSQLERCVQQEFTPDGLVWWWEVMEFLLLPQTFHWLLVSFITPVTSSPHGMSVMIYGSLLIDKLSRFLIPVTHKDKITGTMLAWTTCSNNMQNGL